MKISHSLLVVIILLVSACRNNADQKYAANPYMPLWEHVPDGEPRVFEDPDFPGKYRIYVVGSHDVRVKSYCGQDVHMWSAPVENLNDWRDEGAIFTYPIHNQWDMIYAPDLVEVKQKDGKKQYYLFPHSRTEREAMVCRGDRPDGPFTPINITEDGSKTLKGSLFGFDPAVWIDEITDPEDPDYETGYRAYGYWGYRNSYAAELDPKTMYSARPGADVLSYFLPGYHHDVLFDPEGTSYPSLYEGEDPANFKFFEASSIRKIGNKYLMIFSGYSGHDYQMPVSNASLRYAYGDGPLGPWRSGGVLVDARAIVPNENGTALMSTNGGNNTHGSLQEINGQWYVFYHRAARGFGYARQAMVAPVKIIWDEKPVAEGGKVTIRAYHPFAEDSIWTAKASNGSEYTGAEVTSEGFNVYGLDPYRYYSAGYACFLSNVKSMQDSWDIWDNAADITQVKNGDIIGFKYFGFGGLAKATKGLKAFQATTPGDKTRFNVFLRPTTEESFRIAIMMDGPWANETWKGKKIAEIEVPAQAEKHVACYTADVAQAVEGLTGKHAIYLVAEGPDGALFDLQGIGFSSKNKSIERPVAPTMYIKVGGKSVELPKTPTRATDANGITGYDRYEFSYSLAKGQSPKLTASSDNKAVRIEITQCEGEYGTAIVRANYRNAIKNYVIHIEKP